VCIDHHHRVGHRRQDRAELRLPVAKRCLALDPFGHVDVDAGGPHQRTAPVVDAACRPFDGADFAVVTANPVAERELAKLLRGDVGDLRLRRGDILGQDPLAPAFEIRDRAGSKPKAGLVAMRPSQCAGGQIPFEQTERIRLGCECELGFCFPQGVFGRYSVTRV
jgi:hypothetical protein